MFLQAPSLNRELDLFLEAEPRYLTMDGPRVSRWQSVDSTVFLEQPEMLYQPILVPNAINGHPAIRFQGDRLHFMKFHNLHTLKGPHTFIFVGQASAGFLFDSQSRVTVDAKDLGRGWGVYETVVDSHSQVKGQTMLGANYFGAWDFFTGHIAAFGYKCGVLSPATRDSIHQALISKYGITEEDTIACDSLFMKIRKTLTKPFKR